jgi:photosystem II stability/assembly factor-like uncharacterized protein
MQIDNRVSRCYRPSTAVTRLFYMRGFRYLLLLLLSVLSIGLTACTGGDPAGITPATPEAMRVNGFGTNANHPHSLIAFPNRVLLLATHYGIFRSEDNGANWKTVAAGPGQLMEGLMAYSLVSSPLDSRRVYVLTQAAVQPHKGQLGIYSSTDQGRTWQLASPNESITTGNIYLASAGNDNPDELYIYLNDLGPLGLKVSMDGGQHFTQVGKLPFGNLASLLAIPGMPGHLLAGSSSGGLARSTDGGAKWDLIKGISGSIFELTTSGPHGPIYASGDDGIYVSTDSGNTFTHVYNKNFLQSLTVSPTQPQTLYGKTGTVVYRSIDGGRTWTALPRIKGNLFNLEVDPANPEQVFLSLSYPTEMYRFDKASRTWKSLTPKP